MFELTCGWSLNFLCCSGSGQGVNIARSAIEGPIIGGPFTLIDTEGRLVTERNLMGNWVLLYFGYTSSPDIGPAEVEKMAKVIDRLGLALSFSIFPIVFFFIKFYIDWFLVF